MKNDHLEKIQQIFFNCNRREVLGIINELLCAMEAEESLPPNISMSRNYETAQANPEIHTLPGNLRDARDAIFPFFWGTDGWSSKLHLENVKGPANYASLIGSIACLLKNPNLCIDTYSQRSNELEVKAVTALANLLFYHTKAPWGVFTMGGTISNMYGGRIGIEKVLPQAMAKGLQGSQIAGVVSQAAHYSNATLAGWLGMGTDNLYTIATDNTCAMRTDLLPQLLDELYLAKKRVAFVIATFGSTDAFGIDNIAEIRNVIEDKALQYNVPVPQLHVDAAVGWTLCFLTEYDLDNNPLGFENEILPNIKKAQEAAKTLKFADSITIDFHKMGWGHYPASAFIVNNRDNLSYLFRDKDRVPYFSEAQYRRDPALFTLECSRPAIGPYSVMASLNSIGLTGFQVLVANAMELAAYAARKIDQLEYCMVINSGCIGPHVAWWVLPRGRNAAEIFARLQEGSLEEDKYQRYFSEIKHLFDKRNATLSPEKDAILSFTSSVGYLPCGVSVPAWKAVFFNPNTDRKVIDDMIAGIEEL